MALQAALGVAPAVKLSTAYLSGLRGMWLFFSDGVLLGVDFPHDDSWPGAWLSIGVVRARIPRSGADGVDIRQVP